MTSTNFIAKTLGLLWFLDGLLQLQPQMFGANFVTNVLTPVLNNQPGFIAGIVNWGIQLWSTNMVVTDTLAALLQCAIGVLLFFPLSSKAFKTGLWISIVWGVIVWLCGEGAGQLLTGSASFYTGAPGAVFFYVVLAAFLLTPDKISAKVYPKVAAWTLIFGAALQLQPLFWTAAGSQQVAMASTMEAMPALSTLPMYFSNIIAAHAITSNVILIALPLVIGIALLLKPSRMTGAIALTFLFFVWWFGQDFGQLSTLFVGTATDPNTAPLLALLLIPLY
ncbi:MAG TPA: hypothetical protein VMU27_00535 [Candidatus Paceibacterota bacterium]|nr:hypothetical protein [Candidatus Paceibacterota bacterium]